MIPVLSIVFPVYNERQSLEARLAKAGAVTMSKGLVFVDDSSRFCAPLLHGSYFWHVVEKQGSDLGFHHCHGPQTHRHGDLLYKTNLPTGQMKFFDRLVPVLRFEYRLTFPFGISVIAIAEALPDPEAS